MGKLIKYDIKGSYKLFLTIFIVAFLANLGLYTRIDKWPTPAIYGLVILVIVTMGILTFALSANSFEKELYEDRGYLTLTLPVSGNKIVAAKTISCLIWSAASSIVTILTILIYNNSVLKEIYIKLSALTSVKTAIFFIIINLLIMMISLLLLIFFSVALSKMAVKKKKLSKFLGGVFFIAAIALIGYIDYLITKYIPYSININLINDGTMSISSLSGLSTTSAESFGIQGGNIIINIASAIYNILTMIGLFLGTGYLIDNKIDL
ncbi:ABC-2 transporter permease [Clostridium sp. MB40-C1]|uniref:ABC-2 transporter permease n=1 Tax=Clostridium sp. MB40-C1 TaxID=3070996 RepID=UPI0027E1CA33|nr:ABC-2 transporter permease [Clostridium sp. MB40-C1]WMJ80014.1 ABC-2 transporter permease [Clostridium sp. MB40-C1]